MPTDYQGNSNKEKKGDKPETSEKPEKKVDKVIVGEVVVQKKTLGRRFKDLFVKADIPNTSRNFFVNVMVPAARNFVVDSAHGWVDDIFYGAQGRRQARYGPLSRITYSSPVTRGYARPAPTVLGRGAPPVEHGPRSLPRRAGEDYILSLREDADMVLEQMTDIIDKYGVVSVADLREIMNLPFSPQDNKWGWIDLSDVAVQQIREGWLIDFPRAEPISN